MSPFLDSVVARNVSVLRVRILERSAMDMGNTLRERLLPERTPPSRSPVYRQAVVLKVAVVDRLSGTKTKATLRIVLPNSALCGPFESPELVPGTEWYLSAVPWGSSARGLKLDYVVWHPCTVAVLRVEGDAAIGPVIGATDRVSHEELRALVKQARSDARVRAAASEQAGAATR
jgi:hypothetical protein